MNREIKFRAWDNDNKKMWAWHAYRAIFINENHGEMPFDNFYNKASIDIMQFTGLKDKNGLEIYNGDIVQIPYIDPVGHIHYGTDGKKIVVEFENGMFGFHTNTKFCPLENYIGKTKGVYVPNHGNKTMYGDFIGKVIGNIYENPELINNK